MRKQETKRIGILTSKGTWTIPYCENLKQQLVEKGYLVSMGYRPEELEEPLDTVCILSYSRILPAEFLQKHKHNLVVHASALPKGRGWSPLNWQILEGKNDIPVTLFEAAEEVDSGKIYLRQRLTFDGHELLPEMLDTLGKTINQMILQFLEQYEEVIANASEQEGEPTFYNRRRPEDSELDIDKPIREQFNLLRAVDNERYPAFFRHLGKKYYLKIYQAEEDGSAGNKT